MTDSLRAAIRLWRRNSLRPFLWLLTAASSVSLVGFVWLGWSLWLWVALPAVVLVAALADPSWRRRSGDICRQLDYRYSLLQDSSQLLLASSELAPLAQLQRQRVDSALRQLLRGGELKQFAPRPARGPLICALGACAGILVLVLSTQLLPQRSSDLPAKPQATAEQVQTQGIASALTRIVPPAYTGLRETAESLSFSAAENAEVHWEITLEKPVQSLRMLAANAEYAFSTDETLPSRHWRLTRKLGDSDFYQLQLLGETGAETLQEIYGIQVVRDRVPEFQFVQPQLNVIQASDSDKAQQFAVDVLIRDDYRVGSAEIVLTLASGDGENLRFRNESLPLSPVKTEAGNSHYQFDVPLERFAVEPGDEIYWYLRASDNREPQANSAKSAHFIIRWPQREIFGLSDAEGMAIKVLPEYFRSQRQLIIDTEALLAERETLSEKQFQQRSTSLAYEQNLLRLRYGRFLGEEDSALEYDGPSIQGIGADREETHAEGEDAHGDEHEDHADHGDGHEAQPQKFGDASGVIAAAGHSHDTSEHATLFDPQTKELLRSALNAMWSSHRELSVIEPRASLPHQHTALRAIKEVQQVSRIYLQRIGFEPPTLDEERRLSGERENIRLPQASAEKSAAEVQELRSLLLELQAGTLLSEETLTRMQELPQLAQLAQQPELRMTLSKAARHYHQKSRQQTDCDQCRADLSAILYGLLPAPNAEPVLPRERAPIGSYSDWLQSQSAGGEQSP